MFLIPKKGREKMLLNQRDLNTQENKNTMVVKYKFTTPAEENNQYLYFKIDNENFFSFGFRVYSIE